MSIVRLYAGTQFLSAVAYEQVACYDHLSMDPKKRKMWYDIKKLCNEIQKQESH